MGGYNQLPALHVTPYNPPDPAEGIMKAIQLRSMLQQQQWQRGQQQLQQGQIQMQRQQIADQQAMTAAMQDWDGKDINSLPGLIMKRGGSATAVLGMKQHILEQELKVSQKAKDDAETGSKNIETLIKNNDQIVGQLNVAKDIPDEQLGQWVMQTAQSLGPKEMGGQGLIDPQHVQMAQQLAQQQPAQIRQALDIFAKGYMSQSQQAAKAKAEHEQRMFPAQEQEAQAGAEIKQAEASMLQQGGMNQQMADAKYRQLQQGIAMGQSPSREDRAFLKAYEKQKLLVPVASANVRIAGYEQARGTWAFDAKQGKTVWTSAEELNRARNEEPGRYTEPSYTPEALGPKAATEYFTKGKGGQQLTAFNTAIAHLDTLDRLAGDLANTDIQVFNRAKQAWAEQTGNPAPANFAAAKNAMSGEVAAALKASGATDDEIKKVDSTFNRAQGPAQLKGAINTYRDLLKSKAQMLQRQYQSAMSGQPAFGGGQPSNPSEPTATGPNGHKIAFRGGRWVDAQTGAPVQ